MLGDLVAQSQGQVTSTRVLPLSPQGEVRLEVSFAGTGELLGHEIRDLGTFIQTLRADGILQVEDGSVLMTGPRGEVASMMGFGLGKSTGCNGSTHFASCGYIRTSAQHWKRLNEVAIVSEYEVDQQGHFTVKCWEWK